MRVIGAVMNELVFHSYGGVELKNAVAIVGFPSLGLVSSIATSFLAKELKLDLIASITSPAFPPYAIVQNGIPVAPVRFYAGKRTTNVESDEGIDFNTIVVITSEFVPKPEQMTAMADLIIEWCRMNDVHTMITLDGIPIFEPDRYSTIGVGSTESARSMMEKYGIESFDDGMVRGLSAMLLLKAAEEDFDVITLLGSARQDMPDPKGAAKIMEPLVLMIPELKLDTEPLYKEAVEIEEKIRNQQIQNYSNENIYG